MLDYLDISPLISERTAVFPGDVPFRREVGLHFESGGNLVLSAVHTTVHLGAHADAPIHYHPQGEGIDARSLDPYLGACQVVSVRLQAGERVLPDHLAGVKIRARRVLIKTGSYPDPDRWNGDFNSLSPALIDQLAAQGVVLVGIDTPSIDPADDAALETHQAVYRHRLAILEGVVLDRARDGVYTLVALPLRLQGADASPVRAILLPEGVEAHKN